MKPPSSSLTLNEDAIVVEYAAPAFGKAGHALFVAIDSRPDGGSAFVPFGRGREGSTVILPCRADRIYEASVIPGGPAMSWQEWRKTHWSGAMDVKPEFTAGVFPGRGRITINLAVLGRPKVLRIAVWAKDVTANDRWGELLPDETLRVRGGAGDQALDRCFEVDLEKRSVRVVSRSGRLGSRARIYQLLPRLFSNTNESRIPDGTLAENGVGKFGEITDAALRGIAAMGFTHVWLTGVLNQASATDYPEIGIPAADAALLKGKAGSPYAIRDCFDVSPDYATNPADRLAEFESLILRAHTAGLKVLIDFVPNHVARCYQSTIKAELSFGAADNPLKFFDPTNNFFWLQADSPGAGPPLRLPGVGGGSHLYEPEREYGRVTGNNACTWAPSINDWYETVKLNYGFDFTTGTKAYPHAEGPEFSIPDTWRKMDSVLLWWQELGVDGFRCDMAHMVPPEFWAWALDRARERDASILFIAEAYDNDPMKVTAGNVKLDLLGAGFDAVYDDPAYKVLKGLYDGGKWANDLDAALDAANCEYSFRNSLRYAENHDEVRLASRGNWADLGAAVGPAVSAVLYGVGAGPILLYSGQEVGEPAAGASGFSPDDGRTTIFDYWSMPELAKWVNHHRYDGGRLSPEQRCLREYYGRLVKLVGEPAFSGDFFGLNYANRDNPRFGRMPGESASGHWVYAFLRSDPDSKQRFLCVANLHPHEAIRDLHVMIPPEAISFIGLDAKSLVSFRERLAAVDPLIIPSCRLGEGVTLPSIPPLTAFFLEFTSPVR